MSGGCQFDRFFKFSVFKPVIYYQVGELKMEHNGIRQAKSVIVNRNAYSPGRTIICISYTVYDQVVSGHLRSDLNKLRNYLLLDLALRDPTFAFHEEWFEYHDTIFPFLKLYLQLRSIEGICLNRSLNKFSYRFS